MFTTYLRAIPTKANPELPIIVVSSAPAAPVPYRRRQLDDLVHECGPALVELLEICRRVYVHRHDLRDGRCERVGQIRRESRVVHELDLRGRFAERLFDLCVRLLVGYGVLMVFERLPDYFRQQGEMFLQRVMRTDDEPPILRFLSIWS